MASNDTIKKTLIVALLLCVVCSIVVSSASVMLKPAQIANKAKDFKRNILLAAGMMDETKSIDEIFGQITTRIVDLDTGRFTDEVAIDSYDQRKAAKDPSVSSLLDRSDDIAKIKRREKFAKVYLVEGANGFDKVILPIHGAGLWSTLYGFIALEGDANTVVGLGFYEHGETPGLGGEVDNPRWKKIWIGKQVYNANDQVEISVLKGALQAGMKNPQYKVDGLSGATLTGRGVHNLVQFWLGDKGFAPFLAKLKAGEA